MKKIKYKTCTILIVIFVCIVSVILAQDTSVVNSNENSNGKLFIDGVQIENIEDHLKVSGKPYNPWNSCILHRLTSFRSHRSVISRDHCLSTQGKFGEIVASAQVAIECKIIIWTEPNFKGEKRELNSGVYHNIAPNIINVANSVCCKCSEQNQNSSNK